MDASLPGWSLLWPRELFRSELQAVLSRVVDEQLGPALHLLFEEALRGPDPVEALQAQPNSVDPWGPSDPWGAPGITENPQRRFGRQVLASTADLMPYVPRRYFLERAFEAAHAEFAMELSEDRAAAGPPKPAWGALRHGWISVVTDLGDRGYLDRLAGDRCVDSRDEQSARITALVDERLGAGWGFSWPFDAEDSDLGLNDVLLSLLEVFHDLVARPRSRRWHEFDEHYFYSLYDAAAGQDVYRWKVNDLLRRCHVDLELADRGPDRGLLTQPTDDPRRDLVTTVLTEIVDRGNQDRVSQAIALFRARQATRDDKRRACRELADVLESRRKTVLEKQLVKADEGPLFEIANRFGIRHHRDDQMYDYDEAFLDWIFWWYLATIELTNRLIAREVGSDV